MTKTIGVIGLGSIGMRHAKNLRAMGHHVWGYDTDMSKRLELGYDYTSEPKHWKSVDGIVIAGPSNQHCIELMEIPDHIQVLMEKPIGVCSGDLEHLPDHLKKIAMCGYNLRFHSCVKKAREWLDAGLIGEPIWANFTLGQYNDRPHYLRDGVILNWSHEIDLCLYLLGPGHMGASSTRLTDGKDDLTDILLTHESGCRSTVHLDYITKPEIREFMIGGASGTIKVNLLSRSAILNNGVNAFHAMDTWNDNYIEEMQAFLDRIDGKDVIGCTGEEGLEVLKICLEVRKQAGLE